MTDRRPRLTRAFSVVALVEAATWAGLLVGMLLEHLLHLTTLGVFVFGRLHGAAFTAYVVVALLTWRAQRWTALTGLTALVAGVPPFGTAVFERWARRAGRLDASSSTPAHAATA